MRKAATLLAFLSLCCALSAPAAEKIAGAFGLQLGQVFPEPPASVDKLGYTAVVEFKPSTPNPAFGTYLAFLTPRTHRVCRIVAVATLPDGEAADRFRNSLAVFVQNKYSGTLYGNQLPGVAFVVRQGDPASGERSVTVSAGAGPNTMTRLVIPREITAEDKLRCDVSYEDANLTTQVFKERQLDAIEHFDGAGL